MKRSYRLAISWALSVAVIAASVVLSVEKVYSKKTSETSSGSVMTMMDAIVQPETKA